MRRAGLVGLIAALLLRPAGAGENIVRIRAGGGPKAPKVQADNIYDHFAIKQIVAATVSHAPTNWDFSAAVAASVTKKDPKLIAELAGLLKALPASGTVDKLFGRNVLLWRIDLATKAGKKRTLTFYGVRLHAPGGRFYGTAEAGALEKKLFTLIATKFNPRKIDTKVSGTYTWGKWQCAYAILLRGSKSERRSGKLTYNSKEIPGAAKWDRIHTPWGQMQFMGAKPGSWNSGWLLKRTYDHPIDPTRGRLLPRRTAAERAKALKKNVRQFTIDVRYFSPQDKKNPRISLTLRVPKVADRGTRLAPALQISAEQAGKIVDALLEAGYFHRSRSYALGALELLRGPAYVVKVGDGRFTSYAVIGWNLETLGFLHTVRKVLDGDAAKAMDKLLKALEPQRKKWQKAATTQPAKAPKLDLDATVKLLTKRVGGKWQKAAHNAFLPTKRVVRGYIYAATDKVLVRYIVYPLELFEGRPPVLSTLRMCGNAEILGLSPACVVTVFSTAPADKIAPYSKGVTKALGLKPPKVTRRARGLKADIRNFVLRVWYYGPEDKPYYRLYLTVPPIQRAEGGFEMIRFLDAKQAGKIIDHLAVEGFLTRAVEVGEKANVVYKGPAYIMTVPRGTSRFEATLGWGPGMLARLDALRKALDGDAGKAMDRLLGRLSGHRRQWQAAAAAGKPAAQPAVKWGKAVGGLVCGISAFKPKVQLAVPYEIEVSIKNISKGDILLLKRRFFGKEPLNDRVYFMRADKTYHEFFTYDEKLLPIRPVRRQDFLLLKPNDIYKFTHRTLVYTLSIRKNLKNIEAGIGPMPLTREGTYQMQVRYHPWGLRIAKGTDLGGLKPWKGVLLSAPVEVVVAKAPAKGKAS